jgi:hypothetical protein
LFRSFRYDLALLVAVALLFATLGGHPFYHPDANVGRSLHALQHAGNPGFFRYPGLVIDADALAYLATCGVLTTIGIVRGPDDFFRWCSSGVLPGGIPFYLPALLVTYVFSVAGVVLTYLLTYRLTRDRLFGFIAALFLSTSLLWSADSHFTTVDIPMASLCLATVFSTYAFTRHGTPLRPRQLILLGLLIGLSTSAKYNAVLIAIPVAAATSACTTDRRQWRRHMRTVGLVAAATFLLANPYAVVELPTFLHESFDEAAHGMRGHFGWQHDQGLLYHVQTSLFYALGTPILILSVIGLYSFIKDTRTVPPARRALLLFPLVYYAIVGSSKLAFQRYMIPMLPFVATFAALGAQDIYQMAKGRIANDRRLRAALLLLALLLVTPNVSNVLLHDRLLAGADTRERLRAVFDSSPRLKGATVFGGHYTAVVLPVNVTQHWPLLATMHPDIVVFDSFSHDRFLYDPFKRRRFSARKAQLSDGSVFQLSPFTLPKTQVPFSPKSVYSPYLPDLRLRRMAGPYIELYFADPGIGEELAARFRELGVAFSVSSASSGYYFQNCED